MSDYPEMCPACHKADADLCFCSKAAQDAAWNSRAQPAAPAEQEISAEEKFCDGHCSWAEHHPDCSLSAPPAQPVAHLWQHGETGRTRIVMPDQIFTADANWLLVGPMYLHPAAAPSVAPEPVAWTTLIEIDWVKRNAGRAGSFYAVKAGPNDIPLFAHPPRAPLTSAEIDKAISTSRDALLDHIFEHGTTAEGIASRFREVARAVEAAHGIRGQG